MLYEDVFREFQNEHIRYLVVGGIAVNLYGYVRLTVDLDAMVDLSESNLVKVVKSMGRLEYAPRVPVNPADLISEEKRDKWIREKGAIVFTFVHSRRPSKQVDFFLSNPIDFEKADRRKTVRVVSDIQIPIASIGDIISLKLTSGRPRDKEDIEYLKRITHPGAE